MTNSIAAVRIFTKAILDSKPWDRDPLVLRKHWSEREYSLEGHGGRGSRLCFAMMWDNGVVKPFPPLQRAMQITKEALEADGHKGENHLLLPLVCENLRWFFLVINWIPHRHLEIYKNAVEPFSSLIYLYIINMLKIRRKPSSLPMAERIIIDNVRSRENRSSNLCDPMVRKMSCRSSSPSYERWLGPLTLERHFRSDCSSLRIFRQLSSN